jgi:PadR family transcriptional regulator PadR
MPPKPAGPPQGSLDLLILKSLSLGEMHGLGISRRVEQLSGGAFHVKAGSLFPALYRMEESGWLASSWGTSANNRRAKYYRLTQRGRHRLEVEMKEWERVTRAIALVLKTT